MIYAAIEKRAVVCFHHLLENGADLQQNYKGKTPLVFAIIKHSMPCVYDIIQTWAGAIDVIDENGWTPLHWAASVQNEKAVLNLLSFGANPNKQNFEGATPLHIAAERKNIRIVEMLIEYEADPSIEDGFGTKASEVCRENGLLF